MSHLLDCHKNSILVSYLTFPSEQWRVDNSELWTNINIKKVTVAAASKNNGLTALLAAGKCLAPALWLATIRIITEIRIITSYFGLIGRTPW